jgi:hypothetical protein
MIELAHIAPADTIADVVESGRRTIASIDPDAVVRSARSAALEILPDDWFQPKRRRWPFVAGALLLGAAVSAILLVRGPAMQMIASRRAQAEPWPEPVAEPQLELVSAEMTAR